MSEEDNKNQNQNMEEKKGVAGQLEGVDAARELKSRLEKCEKDKDDYLAGWQRAKADFLNYKKDELKRLEEIARYGNAELISELLTILDNFDLSLRAMERAGGADKGIYMIRAQTEDILKKRGVERIAIKIGELFDPSFAEAVAEIVSDKSPGTILEEIEPGYRLYDKILRPTRVKISK